MNDHLQGLVLLASMLVVLYLAFGTAVEAASAIAAGL